ncbi:MULTISPECIES: hypothetical protein [Thermus]|uniref:hypothetical protein n=1 Tax=Thermus TaxID=270 RepID=UPI001F2C529D|nr:MULTISPECIES: hypothetical protein [Thermus]
MTTPEAKIIRMRDLEAPAGTHLPVAWLDVGGRTEVAVPLARLAEAVGYDLGPLRGIVKRDPVLASYQSIVTILRDGVPHKTAFLQRPGVLGVLVKLSASRIQDPAKRQRVIAFQRWAFETLDRLLFEGAAPAPAQPPLFPVGQGRGDRALAVRMLTGEVRAPDGSLLSYGAIERATGVPKTTLGRWARRLGVFHLRKSPYPTKRAKKKPLRAQEKAPEKERASETDLARLLMEQARLLGEIARRLLDKPQALA